jgi:hypothetical protein
MTPAVARLVLCCNLGSSCLSCYGSRFVALAVVQLICCPTFEIVRDLPWVLSRAPQHSLYIRQQCDTTVWFVSLLDNACCDNLICETVSVRTKPAKFFIGPLNPGASLYTLTPCLTLITVSGKWPDEIVSHKKVNKTVGWICCSSQCAHCSHPTEAILPTRKGGGISFPACRGCNFTDSKPNTAPKPRAHTPVGPPWCPAPLSLKRLA